MAKVPCRFPLLSAILMFMVQLPLGSIVVVGDCSQSGYITCNGEDYPTYDCSPPITGASTLAKLTFNSFRSGGDGGGPAECDSTYHNDTESIVALSTGWYSGGANCFKQILITASNGKAVQATVDECDSLHGCDEEHANQPPCGDNIVDAPKAVWDSLGLDAGLGGVDVTWQLN